MFTEHLPEPLRDYVEWALAGSGYDAAGTLLQQRGEMRTAPDRPWRAFSADQSMAADRCEFRWHARLRIAPFITAVVEDGLRNGRGRLDARAWGLVPVARDRGERIDRGETQRYLAELVWCPAAFIHNRDLRYAREGDNEVRVWVGDERCYVTLRFDDHARVVGVRTSTRACGPQVHPWEGHFEGDRNFGGVRAPARGEVWWDLPEGRFVYWRGEICSLKPTAARWQL